jgi:hypothetical protein
MACGVVQGRRAATAWVWAFRSELWRMHCAELFLASRQPRLSEFNLSPSGAWWSQGFARYREADPAFHRPLGVECYACVSAVSQHIACLAFLTEIALPLLKLKVQASLEQTCVSSCADHSSL